jgi:hypothetical protein
MVWGRVGRVDECLAAFDDVADMIESTSDQTERIQVGQTAPLLLLRGEVAKAQEVAERTLALLEGAPPAGSQILPGVEGTCAALFDLWKAAAPGPRRRALESKALRGIEVLEGFARCFAIGVADALRHRAAWFVAHAAPDRALPLLRRAVVAGRRSGLPVEEGRARVALAGRLDGEARERELESAHEVLSRVNAALYLREIDAVRGRPGSRASTA